MKKCPYCAEEIQDEAIKCKHCGEWLEKKRENKITEKINTPSSLADTQIITLANHKPKPDDIKEIKTDSSSPEDLKILESKKYILQKDKEGEAFCLGCQSVDILKKLYYCRETDQYYHYQCFDKPLRAISKARPAWLNTVYYVYLIIFGLAFLGNSAAVLISPKQPPSMTLMGFSFWCGVTSAVVANRKGKSGWLWFFIGFILIGFSIVFVLSFLQGVIHH